MNQELRIDPEFRSLIPPLTEGERTSLEASIIKDGCLQALIVWDGVIADGHNRYAICQQHGIPFSTQAITFASRDEAKWWIISHQLGRRNLTRVQASYLRGQYWDLVRLQKPPAFNKKAGERSLPDEFRDRQSMIASRLSVSSGVIRNDHSLFKAVSKLGLVAKDYVLSGEEAFRLQHIIDLSALDHPTQTKLVDSIRAGRIKSLAKAITSLRGANSEDRSAPINNCPTCGNRLGRGVTTCLRCDIGSKPIAEALDEEGTGLPEDFEIRLQRVRESRMTEECGDLNDAVEFHAGRLFRMLNIERTPALTHGPVMTLKKLVRRISQIVDLSSDGAKLQGESRWKLSQRSRAKA